MHKHLHFERMIRVCECMALKQVIVMILHIIVDVLVDSFISVVVLFKTIGKNISSEQCQVFVAKFESYFTWLIATKKKQKINLLPFLSYFFFTPNVVLLFVVCCILLTVVGSYFCFWFFFFSKLCAIVFSHYSKIFL